MNKKAVLKNIEEEFKSVGVPCDYIEAGDQSPVDVLISTNEHLGFYDSTAMGEYFFLDYERAAENTEYFVCMMTLDDNLQTDNAVNVIDGITRLNYFIPYGHFTISPDGEIILKMSMPLTTLMSDEAALEETNTVAAHALDLFHRYIGLIIDLAKGKVTPSDVVDLFGA